MKNIGLFRHAAALVKRYQGPHEVACGYPTVFEFGGGGAATTISSLGDTSPFHDLPDGAQVYIEVGVDLDWCSPDVKKIVEEFERHGRRPKFGPPLPRDESDDVVTCSFCHKENHEVTAIIAGPRANICNECIALCFETLQGPKP